MTPNLEGARAYVDAVRAIQDQVIQTQAEAISQAAGAIVEAVRADRMVYIFGTGHSSMMAQEGHFRAGGLAAVCPMFLSALMLHEGGVLSGRLERLTGLAQLVVDRYALAAGDVLIVFSNSGVNAVPVEAAMAAKSRGVTVIAVMSGRYAAQAPLGPAGKRLSEVADIVIDNGTPPGDALVHLGDGGLRTGPASTVVGALILNATLAEAAWRLAAAGEPVPAYISSNLPGAAAHNAHLIARYRARNPHL